MTITNRINAELAASDFSSLIRYTFGNTTSRIQAIDVERAIQHGLLNIDNAACGCFACDDGVQPGHFACSQPSEWALEMERAGLISRAYTDERADGSRSLSSAWRWEVVE
jgi:hypothetical protein